MPISTLNQPKRWSASSGRFERILIFYLGLLAAGIFYIRIMIFLGIVVIPITLKRLFATKLAREVIIDCMTKTINLGIGRSTVKLGFDELGYAFNSAPSSHNELALYRIYEGTRGQLVKKDLTKIVGMKWTTSWKKSQVTQIAHELELLNITEFKPENKELPLWERFI